MDNNNSAAGCGYKCGGLPGLCAPLGVSYVPMQCSALPAYDPQEALARGTLFPGLDLPFMNLVNTPEDLEDCPLTELMALDFVALELGMYLDTHPDDTEAFAMYQDFLTLCKEARRRYVELYGPLKKSDLLGTESFTWLNDPWPWDYKAK